MLKEVKHIKKKPEDKYKRWFSDDYFDLILWQNDKGEIQSFQLCYNKTVDEHVIHWVTGKGCSHFRIDDGEEPGRMKKTPIFIADGIADVKHVSQKFFESSANIDKSIAYFIIQILLQYSREL